MLGVERYRYDARLPKIDRAGAASTVVHTRDHEEPIELAHVLHPPIRGDDAIEVVNRSLRKDQLVSPTVIGDYLAAVRLEGREIRVLGSDDGVELRLRLPEARCEASGGQRGPVETRVLFDPEPPMIERDCERQSDRRRVGCRVC